MIPRNEHPDPQAERARWMNLNGEWEFEIDQEISGAERKLFEQPHLSGHITVPFCPESKLSGVENRDFMNCVWYRRDIEIPQDWRGGRVLLHFGAVDHTASVYLNGQLIGTHSGGYASFRFDITDALRPGANSLCVSAEDDHRGGLYGRGKQCSQYESFGCLYTRVTGIWQTVWLEWVPATYIREIRLTPDICNSALTVEAGLEGAGTLTAEAYYEGKPVGTLSLNAPFGGWVRGTMKLSELHLWEPGAGRLYDLKLTFEEDRLSSYFGMREITLDGYRFLLNGKSVFQRLVLDQGYYPDGVYTAPTDEALQRDIQISMDAGFNGARLHQKVFEPRFLYYCDKMGYLVWGEYGSWGINHSNFEVLPPMFREWGEILARDYNHPSIIGWCPFNETFDYGGKKQSDDLIRIIYKQTKTYDPLRPCIDTSGSYHIQTDIYDIHDYTQNPEAFAEVYGISDPVDMMECYSNKHWESVKHSVPYRRGEPLFVSEYGGIKWDLNAGLDNAWGYGDAPKNETEFLERYQGLTDVLLDHPCMLGFCYTQLYDVEQETNGLYTYDRHPKFDMALFRRINTRKAAIED